MNKCSYYIKTHVQACLNHYLPKELHFSLQMFYTQGKKIRKKIHITKIKIYNMETEFDLLICFLKFNVLNQILSDIRGNINFQTFIQI